MQQISRYFQYVNERKPINQIAERNAKKKRDIII